MLAPTSNYLAYAQPVQDLDLNYIRNSAKVVWTYPLTER
jgi:hypothetical protein